MDKVESSASDVVIEMECLEKVEKELCQKEVNKKDIRIYVNELNAAACDETPLIENKSTKKVRETPYFIEWQSPIVEWLNPIRDWQVDFTFNKFLPDSSDVRINSRALIIILQGKLLMQYMILYSGSFKWISRELIWMVCAIWELW